MTEEKQNEEWEVGSGNPRYGKGGVIFVHRVTKEVKVVDVDDKKLTGGTNVEAMKKVIDGWRQSSETKK